MWDIKSGKYKDTYEMVIDTPITFKNCYLKNFIAGECAYVRIMVLEGCVFEQAAFDTCYANSGMTLDRCQFRNDIFLFAWSGNNQQGKPIIISDCIFDGFVDMYDAWFEGPITVSRNRFIKGTNLLGNRGQPYQVRFDVAPIIEENERKLDLDGEITSWKNSHNLPNMPIALGTLPRRKRFLNSNRW